MLLLCSLLPHEAGFFDLHMLKPFKISPPWIHFSSRDMFLWQAFFCFHLNSLGLLLSCLSWLHILILIVPVSCLPDTSSRGSQVHERQLYKSLTTQNNFILLFPSLRLDTVFYSGLKIFPSHNSEASFSCLVEMFIVSMRKKAALFVSCAFIVILIILVLCNLILIPGKKKQKCLEIWDVSGVRNRCTSSERPEFSFRHCLLTTAWCFNFRGCHILFWTSLQSHTCTYL